MNRKDVEDLIEKAAAGGYQINLHGADLTDADLSGLDLSGANLHGAILDGANLEGTILSRSNLHGASLDGVTTDEETKLEKVNLHGAKFGDTKKVHKDTSFEGSNIFGSDATDDIKKSAATHEDPVLVPKKKGKVK